MTVMVEDPRFGGWHRPEGWRIYAVARCRSCSTPIAWAFTSHDKHAPVDRDGTPHFATCPQAARWRRTRVAPESEAERRLAHGDR